MTIWTKQSPSTRPPDPAAPPPPGAEDGVLHAGSAWSGPVAPPRREGALTRLRRRARRHPFRLLVLLPTAPALAMRELARLPQPFTVSQARQALGTSRRVAVPLLELLDGRGWTRRLDAGRREVAR